MFSRIGQAIFDHQALLEASNFKMGLEIEMQRVDETGHLSQEPYPAAVGDEKENPWITNDFLETMSEIVTPPAGNATDAIHYLYSINTALRIALAPGELLWPLSMPPILPKDRSKVPIAKAGPEKERYLRAWLKRHSISEGTPSGAHINLSINPALVKLVRKSFPDRFSDEVKVRNYLYQIITQGFVRYRWLLTYLFGASPVAEQNFFENGATPLHHPVRCIRQSRQYGFGTKFVGDYSSVENYVTAITSAIEKGKLLGPSEFHGPVRFKGAADLNQMAKQGVEYIELRMLDLDPTSQIGIRTGTLRFIRLLAGYFIMNTALNPEEVPEVMKRADTMNETVALEDPVKPSAYAATAKAFIRHLRLFVNELQAGPEYLEIIDDLEYKVDHPKTTLSGQLAEQIKDNSLVEYALKQAHKHQDGAMLALHPFRGFEENGGRLSADELTQQLFGGTWKTEESL
ncbi:MAG: glutamate--cysteine ligase [Limosilactobacillus gorillae]|jgi:glutamate--cysteine ligase|nr:glutamate--cysteine ligase [Limosilactobacillus gorillae]